MRGAAISTTQLVMPFRLYAKHIRLTNFMLTFSWDCKMLERVLIKMDELMSFLHSIQIDNIRICEDRYGSMDPEPYQKDTDPRH